MIREKKQKSGKLLEVDYYPVFDNGKKVPTRAPKTKRSTEEQEKYNRKQAIKKFLRLVNENFDESDYLFHPTYSPENAPNSEKEARKDLTNFFRRIKYRREKELKAQEKALQQVTEAAKAMPGNDYIQAQVKKIKETVKQLKRPFKYAYVVEKVTYQRGRYKGRDNYHFHVFMTGGLKRDDVENMFTGGLRCNCDRYQPDKFGPEAAAKYFLKNPEGKKSYSYSKNMQQPKPPKITDGATSRTTVEKMATQRIDDKTYWENRFRGYRFVRCYARRNIYNGHVYVSVVMYKTDETPPEWKISDWITEDE